MLDQIPIPVEMRAMSVTSFILFSVGSGIIVYMHLRIMRIEQILEDRCIDIERLEEMMNSTEKSIKSMSDENHKFIDWIKDDNTSRWDRIENDMSEIRKQLYRKGGQNHDR